MAGLCRRPEVRNSPLWYELCPSVCLSVASTVKKVSSSAECLSECELPDLGDESAFLSSDEIDDQTEVR